MRLQIASDLHLEFPFRKLGRLMEHDPAFPLKPRKDVDALLLVGDILVLTPSMLAWFVDYLGALDYPVLYVLGNHEFYGQEMLDAIGRARSAFQGSNIVLLDDDEIILNKGGEKACRFLGSTLWTDYESGSCSGAEALREAEARMADHRLIRTTDSGGERIFMPEDAARLHRSALRFIEARLADPFAGKTVVMTHHSPSSVYGDNPAFPRNPLTGAFCSDLDHLFAEADLWAFGHTHHSVDIQLGRLRLVSNQCGYSSEYKRGNRYDPQFVVEL